MQPPQPPTQQFQPTSGSSMDYDQILGTLISLMQDLQNQGQGLQKQAKKLGELKSQMGEIVEFMGQIQAQSELSNSTNANSTEDFEFAEAITLESSMDVGTSPKMSKPSQEKVKQLLLEEEEEDKAMASLEEPLLQPILVPPPLLQLLHHLIQVRKFQIQFFLTPFHQMSLFLAGSYNPRKKRMRKASSKPFQRFKRKKWLGNV